MFHFGLLITKDDDEIAPHWFAENSHYFDEIVCLDGSNGDAIRVAAQATQNVIYLHEKDWNLRFKTDHGLRDLPLQLITHRHGHGHWITLCHVDEFFYHDPRLCCMRAQNEGWDSIGWYTLHFLPHPNDLSDWPRLSRLPPHERFRWFHWDYQGSARRGSNLEVFETIPRFAGLRTGIFHANPRERAN